MLSLLKSQAKRVDLRSFPLKSHEFRLSLDKLVAGVDNIRIDVFLSPKVCAAIGKMAYRLLAEKFGMEEALGIPPAKGMKERRELGGLCRGLLLDGINKAKSEHQVQIDSLTQVAIVKMVVHEIQSQHTVLLHRFKNNLWKKENAKGRHHSSIIKLKEKLAKAQQNQKKYFRAVAAELFQYFIRVQQRDLQEMREANFGVESLLPDDIFSNPMIHAGDAGETFFLIEAYNLMFGNRLEDPDKYDTLHTLLKDLLRGIDSKHRETDDPSTTPDLASELPIDMQEDRSQEQCDRALDSILMCPDNIHILLNYFETAKEIKRLKTQKASKEDLLPLKQRIREQKKLLGYFFSHFRALKLTKRFAAFYEMQPVYPEYCPPLIPQQVLQFLLLPGVRKEITKKLNRLKKFYNKSYPIKPLRNLTRNLEKISTTEQKKYLIRFLENFSRYHRDRSNFNILWEHMEKTNLTSDEKTINLSRANNTLYEILLPDEHKAEETAVLNHVIIKADIRGSTDITHKMKARELNPASYFSLNFFDPITELLEEYCAIKVFIEGDAIILAILEREDDPGGWYSVARACGLAINMLNIIRRYNIKSKENRLPILELGIGITFRRGPPTFLFDGDNRIMISPAINLADRLSGCSKSVRKQLADRKKSFNLYVYQSAPEEDVAATADDLMLRYNVNGIELNEAGFKKLSEEISLKEYDIGIPDHQEDTMSIFAGKFPTASGNYRHLVIRQAQIPEVEQETLTVNRLTDKKYYEVCTHPNLYKRTK